MSRCSRRFAVCSMQFGINQAQSYCIHANRFRCDFTSQSNCEAVNRPLGRRIVHALIRRTGVRRTRRNIYDRSASSSIPRGHAPNSLSRTKQCAHNIHGKHSADNLRRNLLHPRESARDGGIIDSALDGPQFVLCDLEHPQHFALARHVCQTTEKDS